MFLEVERVVFLEGEAELGRRACAWMFLEVERVILLGGVALLEEAALFFSLEALDRFSAQVVSIGGGLRRTETHTLCKPLRGGTFALRRHFEWTRSEGMRKETKTGLVPMQEK
jgi:hypothetical protein